MIKKLYFLLFILMSCTSTNNFDNSPLINYQNLQDIKEILRQKISGEFKVNTNNLNSMYPKISSDNNGNFVVTWIEENKIKARIFYSDKKKKSLEFLVSDSLDIDDNTRVSCFLKENIFFVWNVYEKEKENYVIKLKVYSLDVKEKNEIIINNPEDISKIKTKIIYSNFYTPIQEHKFFKPNIDIFVDKNLSVVSYNSFSKEGNSNIYINILKDNKKYKELIISDKKNNYFLPKIIIYNNNVYISYLEYENNKIDIKNRKTNIYFRIYDIEKDKLSEPIKVNNSKLFSEDIYLERANDIFILIWATYSKNKYSNLLEDSYSEGIYIQKIDKEGKLIDKNNKIIKEDIFIQSNPKIKSFNDGYVLSWQKEDILKGDKFIYAKILNKDFVGKEFKVSNINYNNDYDINILDKEFIFVWDSFLNFDDISQILSKRFNIVKK
jgi:hypothetical protein